MRSNASRLRKLLSAQWVTGMELQGEARDLFDDERRSEADFLRQYINADVFAVSDPLSSMQL